MSETSTVEDSFDDSGDDSEHGPIIRLLLAIRGSFPLFAIFLGIVMIVAGVAVELTFTYQGVLAAMLVVWGVSAILYGALGFVFALAIQFR